MNITQNLERRYKNFIDQEKPFDFFKGLAAYLDYVFSVPVLKKEFDKQMAERRVLYKQIEEAEEQTKKELDEVKKKLLSIIKKVKVDIKSFVRYQTWAINESTDIFEEIEAYEKGKALGSTFIADEVEKHLFDVAANLLKAGHEKELREFLVTPREYAMYYQRINGPSQYFYVGNQYGNFIFSKTWPERWEKTAQFENDRVFKPWGSFEELLQFHEAYKLASTTRNLSFEAPPKGIEDTPWFGAVKESVKILSMAHELHKLAENEHDFYSKVNTDFSHKQHSELKNLKQIALKKAVQNVHNRLIEITENSGSKDEKKIGLKGTKIDFDDAVPAIMVNDKQCALPPAQNEHYLARAIFSRRVGEYTDWSIIHKAMTGSEEIGDDKDQKSVRDTMNRLNKRIKEVIGTSDDLLSWKNKSVARNF